MDQQLQHMEAAPVEPQDEGSLSKQLLHALKLLAQHHDKSFSEAVALAGLPLKDGKISISVFESACKNLGLSAKVMARAPSSVPGIVCPFVIFFKTGDVGIVTSRKSGSTKLSVRLVSHNVTTTISVKNLDRDTHNYVIYVAPQMGEALASEQAHGDQSVDGHWLWSTVRRFWGSWVQVAITALFVNILGLALPIFVMNVYDRVIPYNAIPTLWALAGGVVLALCFDFILRMLRSLVIDRSGRRIDMKVSSDIYRHALDAKMADRPQRAGDIANQIREFESVRDFFTSASLTSAIDLVFVGLFLFVLWLIVGPLALVPLVAVPIVLLTTLLIQIPLGRSVAKGLSSTTNRHSVLVESMVGVETVKAIAGEGTFQKKWEQSVAESVRATSSSRFWSSLAIFFSMLVQQAVSVVIIIWGVFLVSSGDISVGALIASNILAGRVLAPLGGIATTVSRLQQSILSYKNLGNLMTSKRDHGDGQRQAGEIVQGRLQFREVGFSYPNEEHQVLQDISLTVSPGERIGIVGRVGSGKSTLGKLLCGLYDATEGAILLDDVDISHRHVADLRKAVSYVGQEPDLFTGTVRDNILFSDAANVARFETATQTSGVASFVQHHPLGFEMQVGERGQQVSGGQRQAIALARALVSEPKILFLDEPTSAMDNVTEAGFVRNMKQSSSSDTTLIIATHRTSLLDLVDRIIVLDGGRIVSDGPKTEILNKQRNEKSNAKTVKRDGK